MAGKFLPSQLIYEGKTRRCLPKFDFPADFNVTFSDNYWSNTEKSIELFEKVIFPFLKQVKASLNPANISTSDQRCFNVYLNVDLTLKMKQNPTSDFQRCTTLITTLVSDVETTLKQH